MKQVIKVKQPTGDQANTKTRQIALRLRANEVDPLYTHIHGGKKPKTYLNLRSWPHKM